MTDHLSRSLEIGDRTIDDVGDCYVIAEIGHNHQGSVETCKTMFRAAAEAGANAVKLQKRDNRSLYTRAFFDKAYNGENSFGRTYGEHREALEFDAFEYAELMAYASELGVAMFATAFDLPSVEFLEQFDMPAYKVASADVNNHPLLREVARTRRPIIFSTGGAAIEEVRRAHEVLSEETDQLCVLQCTAGYPAAWDELDLRVIDTYRRIFPSTVVGLSSHDNGIAMVDPREPASQDALDRTMRGSDHPFSLEPQGLRKMVRDLGRARLALGQGIKRVYDSERAPIEKMSKKLVAARRLEAGCVLAVEDIALRSPGNGLAPAYLDRVVGRRLKTALEPDGDLTLELVEEVTPPPSPASPARAERKRKRVRV